jgi:hypothetical protein
MCYGEGSKAANVRPPLAHHGVIGRVGGVVGVTEPPQMLRSEPAIGCYEGLGLVAQQYDPIPERPLFDESKVGLGNVFEERLALTKNDRYNNQRVFINEPEIGELLDDGAAP